MFLDGLKPLLLLLRGYPQATKELCQCVARPEPECDPLQAL